MPILKGNVRTLLDTEVTAASIAQSAGPGSANNLKEYNTRKFKRVLKQLVILTCAQDPVWILSSHSRWLSVCFLAFQAPFHIFHPQTTQILSWYWNIFLKWGRYRLEKVFEFAFHVLIWRRQIERQIGHP